MRKIHVFMEHAVEDMKAGQESWRVKSIIALYAFGGAIINITILKALG